MARPPVARRPSRRRLSFDALEVRQVPALIGPELAVNVKVLADQSDPAVASSYSGRSIVVWTDVKVVGGADTDIRARLYNAAGVPVGADIIINNTGFIDSQPTVAMDTVGEFVVAWTRRLPTGDRNVQVARFSSAGVNLGGLNTSITVAGTPRPEYDPAIAVNRIGDFVVSYTIDTAAANQDILARRYSDTGAFLGGIIVANTPARETHSSISRILDGRFAIAYQRDGVGGSSDILMRRYTSAGALVGIHNIATTADSEQLPSVAMDETGNGVVAYQRRNLFTGYNIRAKRFTSAGVILPEINIRSTLAQETAPSVAIQRFGSKFVVAYNGGGNNVFVSEVSPANVVVTLAPLPTRGNPAVSMDSSSIYQVAYETVAPLTDGSGRGIRRRRGIV